MDKKYSKQPVIKAKTSTAGTRLPSIQTKSTTRKSCVAPTGAMPLPKTAGASPSSLTQITGRARTSIPEQTRDDGRFLITGKMSLVCQLKMATLRREANLLKQTLPLTDDLVAVLKDKMVLDSQVLSKLKVNYFAIAVYTLKVIKLYGRLINYHRVMKVFYTSK